MSADVPADERRENAGDPSSLSEGGIEHRVRSTYGPRLDACRRVLGFAQDALHDWNGRTIHMGSVDPIVLAESGRATKTYAGIMRLLTGGFGPQAAMLNRSQFEGMAIAHWAHATPERAIELFKKHSRHSELLSSQTAAKSDGAERQVAAPDTADELKELGRLFGPRGTRLWTGHRNLHELVGVIENQWSEGPLRDELWWYFDTAHSDNNKTLHSTARSLRAGVVQTPDYLKLDIGASDLQLDRALIGSLWVYHQTVTLLWDHFALPDRGILDETLKSAWCSLQTYAEEAS